MNSSSKDPVADVLLDFQSVMAQFLELQTDMLDAFASRKSHIGVRELTPLRTIEPVHIPAPTAHPSSIVASPVVEAAAAPAEPAFSRYTLALKEQRLPPGRAGLARGQTILLTDDGRGVASQIAERLRLHDERRVALISAGGHALPRHDHFVSTLDSIDEMNRIAAEITERCGPVCAVIHLMPLAATPGFDELDAEGWWQLLSRDVRTLFLLARTFGTSLNQAAEKGGAAIIAATSIGGAFGIDSHRPVANPSQGAVTGFMKSLATEWPAVRTKTVDIETSAPIEDAAAHLLDELWSSDFTAEIGYLAGRRVAIDVVRMAPVLDESFTVPSDAVVLATGGARGITAEICLELGERCQPTFVLVGQSPLPPLTEEPDTAGLTATADIKRALLARLQTVPARVTPAMVEKAYRQLMKEREVRETIGRLTATGARTHYVQLDVTDEDKFGALVDDIYATYGRLDGVIHGAGIIEDKLVRDKSLESFDRVLRTKTLSAFVLTRHLKPESLRFVVLFSSVAGRFGNRGQSDYAAGNEVVSKLATLLQRRWPVRVCSMAWAPWDKLGMVSPELKEEFARRGVELLAPSAGRRAFWSEIQQPAAVSGEVVIGGHAATPISGDVPLEPLPLIKDATRNSAPGGAIRFLRVLDPAVDVYLNDHRLDGKPVLPLAFATEFMAEAAQAAWPDLRVVAVRNLQLMKGITVDAPVHLVINVRGAVHSNAEGLTDVDVEIATPSQNPPVRYRAVVQLAANELASPEFDAPAAPLVPFPTTVDRAYREWTFHGPLFQRIAHIAGIGSDAMIGTIVSPSATAALATVRRPEWIIDPFVFDAALQMLLIWSRVQNDKTALPSRFRFFRRFQSLSDQTLKCFVGVESLAGGHALKSWVHFVDGSGRLLAVLDTMEASCTNALNRLTSEPSRSTAR